LTLLFGRQEWLQPVQKFTETIPNNSPLLRLMRVTNLENNWPVEDKPRTETPSRDLKKSQRLPLFIPGRCRGRG